LPANVENLALTINRIIAITFMSVSGLSLSLKASFCA